LGRYRLRVTSIGYAPFTTDEIVLTASAPAADVGSLRLTSEAIALAGIEGSGQCPAVAVHGLLAKPDQVLREGDRVELLRPLLADPKDNRRRRARAGS
jgi:putative ubiquitin-RnfH superfamily antitoxin RatB of RatAB toxin-antitoxin module